MKDKTVHIDGDVIVYQAGFASDKILYTVEMIYGTEGFKYKKEAIEFCKDQGVAVSEIKKHVTPEPINFCLNSVKQMITSIIEATGADQYKVYLTGKGNFREEMDHEYKANRDPNHKPTHYAAIKEYLIKHHEAEVVDGMEADDAMGIAQTVINNKFNNYDHSVIASIDKDMLMIPGWHFNWNKGVDVFMNEDDAIRHFYKQCLTGDAADNIKGIKGIGEKRAEKILGDCEDEISYFNAVAEAYDLHYGDEAADRLSHAADLLWIMREDGKGWELPEGVIAYE